MWKVTATGESTGRPYVYEVDAPEDAWSGDIFIMACAAHGTVRGSASPGVVEFLSTLPNTYTLEYVQEEEN